jgi:nucleoside-diphosphate-sugar epimerase
VLTRQSCKSLNQDGIEIFKGDLSTTQDWAQALQGVHVVVNIAAEIYDYSHMQEVNVQGPLRLLEAAIQAGVSRWVQMSSVGAYGTVLEGLVTEDWLDRPKGVYEISKADFDVILKNAANQGNIEVCIVRPSNVYGPNMRNQSIYQLMNIISKGWFAYIGPLGASANYVHVDDVVQALDLCTANPRAANQTYIISAWTTMEDMVNALADGLAVASPKKRLNINVAKLLAIVFQKWARWPLTLSRVKAMSSRSQYSTQKIENELGWKVSVPVSYGMSQLAKSKASKE